MKSTKTNLFRSNTALAIGFSVACFSHFTTSSAYSQNYYWDNDGATPGFGTATGTWAAPTTGNGAQGWSTDSTGATLPTNYTTTTADTLNFGSSTAFLAAGTITISGTVNANKVVFGTATSGPFTLSGGTIALGGTSPSITNIRGGQTIGSALTLNANTSIITNTSGTAMTLNGVIDGPSNLTFTTFNSSLGGSNTFFFLGAASTYAGTTTITTPNANNNLTVRPTVNNALPTTTILAITGVAGPASATRILTFDLNNKDQTIAGLTNTPATRRTQQVLSGTGTSLLTINNTSPASSTFSGNITTGMSLAKSGTGTQVLSGANSYPGNTNIIGGKLQGVVGGNCAASKMIISNTLGTLGIAVTDNTLTWTCKELAPTAAGTIEFDFGSVTPSNTVSPLTITVPIALTGLADFTAATPKVQVNVTTGLIPGTYPLMTWDAVSGTVPTTADLTVSTISPGTAASLSVTGNTLNLVISSTAPIVVKANNTNNLNLGTSWVGGVAPDSTKIARWNSTVGSSNTTSLGANVTFSGISIENPGGPVTINAGNTLTLGSAAIDLDLSTANNDLTLNCPLVMSDAHTWSILGTRTVTLGGQVSGAFAIDKLGVGTAVLSSSANSYTGNTVVSAGTLRLGANNVIPDGIGNGNVSLAGTLDLNGKSETVNGLSGAGIIDNTLTATSPVLTVGGNDQTSTFSGVLQNSVGTLNLAKIGTGSIVLGGANTLTGSLTVSSGTLAFSNNAPFANASSIIMAGGTTLRPDVGGNNLTFIAPPITVGATGTTTTITAPTTAGSGTTAVTVSLSSPISGDGNVTFLGLNATNSYGTIFLNAPSTYLGSTTIDTLSAYLGGAGDNCNIFVRLGVANALPITTVLTLDGGNGAGSGGRFCDLNISGFDQTLAGVNNVTGLTLRNQRIRNSGATATLTVNTSGTHIYTASLGDSGPNLNLAKSGSGTQSFTGPLAYAGNTTVSQGTLSLGSLNTGNDASTVSIAASGATLALNFSGGDTVDKLFIGGTQQSAGTYGAVGSVLPVIAIPQITGTGTLIVSTGPSGGGFSSWITGTFANGTVPAPQRGASQDPDNDGISNLVEYAVAGEDPTVPKASVGTFAANVLSFTKRAGTSGLTYAIQDSTDLGVSDAWATVTGGSYVNNATTISFTLTPGSPVRNFVRLQVLSN